MIDELPKKLKNIAEAIMKDPNACPGASYGDALVILTAANCMEDCGECQQRARVMRKTVEQPER